MTKNSAIIGFGVLVAVVPFLGLPIATKEIIFIVAGLVIAIIGYFSNVQYCTNCKRIIDNGQQNVGNSGTHHQDKELKRESRKDISGISPPEMK